MRKAIENSCSDFVDPSFINLTYLKTDEKLIYYGSFIKNYKFGINPAMR